MDGSPDAQGAAAVEVVLAFNDAIGARAIDVLAELMTEDHRFIDAAGGTVDGRSACLEAWRGFFAAFPDYRNVFDSVSADASGLVTAHGRSECSDPRLVGPARWTAVVVGPRVAEWRVDEATP